MSDTIPIRACNKCKLSSLAKEQAELYTPNLGVNNHKVLFIIPPINEGDNDGLTMLAYYWKKFEFDFKVDSACYAVTRCSIPNDITEFEKKKLIKTCSKEHLFKAIDHIKPLIVVLVGEDIAKLFPKVILQECKANKDNCSYKSICPDILYYYIDTGEEIVSIIEKGDKKLPEEKDKLIKIENTFKKIKGSMLVGVKRKEVDYRLVDTLVKVKEAFQELISKPILAIDIETSSLSPYKKDAKIITISFTYKEQQAICFPLYHPETPFKEDLSLIVEVIKSLLINPNSVKIFHNGKFDCQYIYKTMGIEVVNFKIDTMLAHYCLDELKGTHSLKRLALQLTDLGDYDDGIDQYKENNKLNNEDGFEKIPLDVLWVYNCCDTDATMRLWNIFKERLEKEGFMPLFNHLMNLSEVLLKIERNGFIIDKEYLKILEEKYINKIDELEETFFASPEVEKARLKFQEKENNSKKNPKYVKFNPSSTHHMRTLFWDILKLKRFLPNDKIIEFLTAAGKKEFKSLSKYKRWKNIEEVKDEYLSTAETTLEYLSKVNAHELTNVLQEYRKTSKLYSSYIQPAQDNWVSEDGLIHSNYKIHGTVSGRLASEAPNMQNIPRGSDIKKLFISRFKNGYIGQLDYSQIEFRVASILSKDPILIDAYKKGLDVHKKTASLIYDVPEEKVTKEQRQYAKGINFGIIYGKKAYALAIDLNVSFEEAEKFLNNCFGKFPYLYAWLKESEETIISTEKAVSKFNRVRRFVNLKSMSRDRQLLSKTNKNLREGINHIVQSTAADFTLFSMVFLQKIFETKNYKSLILGSVYDSILIDIHPDEVQEVFKIAKQIMEGVPKLLNLEWVNIPLLIEAEIGISWGDAKVIVYDELPDLEEGKEIYDLKELSFKKRVKTTEDELRWVKC